MPDFTYIARDRQGRVVEGRITAINSAVAVGKVQEMGYHVERVRATEVVRAPRAAGGFAANFVYPVVSGVRLTDLAVMYRQFATLLNAGISLGQSLSTLQGQTRNAKLREALRKAEVQVQSGGPLSHAFGAYPWIFSELQLEMIRAGERGGMLELMLRRIADYLDQELALRRLISRLTLNPKLVFAFAWMVLGVRFVTSRFMPALSRVILGSMGMMRYSVWDYLMETVGAGILAALIVFAVVAFCRIVVFQSRDAQIAYERLKYAIPGVGKVAQQFALAKFGRAFGAMYAAGIPMSTAIRAGGAASGSQAIASAAERATLAAENGATLSQAFLATGPFPPLVIDMLHTGEQTGNVDAMMLKVAEYLEGEAEQKAHLYASIFAIGVFLIVAILVAIAIIGFYLNYAGAAAGGGAAGGGGDQGLGD